MSFRPLSWVWLSSKLANPPRVTCFIYDKTLSWLRYFVKNNKCSSYFPFFYLLSYCDFGKNISYAWTKLATTFKVLEMCSYKRSKHNIFHVNSYLVCIYFCSGFLSKNTTRYVVQRIWNLFVHPLKGRYQYYVIYCTFDIKKELEPLKLTWRINVIRVHYIYI